MELEFHQIDLRYENLRVRRPDREGRLLSSLAEKGQQMPIVVVPLAGEVKRYLVIDGYKRVRALKRIGQDTVVATVWDMSEEAALMLDHSMRSAEAESAIEQGWLLSELHRSFGKSLEELSDQFDRSVSWVTRRLALVEELPESVQEQVRRGRIGPHAAGKYLVPMARASRESCEQLVEKIAPLKLSNRDIAELYGSWRDGSRAMQGRLIQEPALFLKARQESELPAEPVRPAEALLRDLDLIGGIARRADRQLRSNGSKLSREENEQVQRCLMQAQLDLQRLSRRLTKAGKEELDNDDDDSGSESGDSGDEQEGCEQSPDCQDPEALTELGGEGHSVEHERGSGQPTSGEGGPVSRGDSAAACLVQGEPGSCPRGAGGARGSDLLHDTDSLLPSSRYRSDTEEGIRGVPLRPRRGDPARHLATQDRDRGEAASSSDSISGAVLLQGHLLPVLPDVHPLRLQGVSDGCPALLRGRLREDHDR